MEASQRIVFNTGITYLRFIITIFLAFYTTRITLQVLGVNDFGLYNVIGGIVAMVAFLNTALAQATQRFLSFHLGSNDVNEVKKVFANSIIIHAALAIVLLIGLEVVGVYYINNVLNVAPERLYAANFLLQFSIAATMLTIISVPYDALLFAHENMLFIAIINLFQAILKLCIVLGLFYYQDLPFDKLISYGFLIMIATLTNRIILQIYVRKKYKNLKVPNVFKEFNKAKLKEQASFAGWNLLNVIGYVARNSGLALVLNAFMGTRINASYAIGNQISNQARFFSSTLFQAVNPQIIKNEGSNNRKSMVSLALLGSRYATLLICLCAIPILFNMQILLDLWLDEIPEYTALISIMLLISVILNELTAGLETMVYAIGNIKTYSIVLSSIKILSIPAAILILYLDLDNSVFIVFCMLVTIEFLTFTFRIVFVSWKKLTNLIEYYNLVLSRILLPIAIYGIINYFISIYADNLWVKLIGVALSICIYLLVVYHITLEKDAKLSLRNMVKALFNRRKND
ncbi:MAG: lipopolysaccharide biosynthesis protein [Maribacter sp.]